MNGSHRLALVLLTVVACTSELPADEVIRPGPDLGGNTLLPDGAIIGPDGEVIHVDGGRGSLDGAMVGSDGAVVGSDGSTTGPDGSILLPDGAVIPDRQLIRFAHMVPDGPNLRLCLGLPGFPTPFPPLPSQEESTNGVAFREVAEYRDFPTVGFTDIEIRAFDAAVFGASGDCSTGATPLARLVVRNVGSLTGSHYTIAAIGLANPSAASCPGDDGPEACGSGEEVRITLIEDTTADPANTRVRLVHAVPNLRRSIGVCHDPDGAAGGSSPVELIAPISLGGASTYASRRTLTFGTLRFFTAAGCAGTQLHELAIPTPGALVSGMPTVDINDTYGAGEVTTLFAAGIRGAIGARADAYVPVLDVP